LNRIRTSDLWKGALRVVLLLKSVNVTQGD